ncbi:MAG: low temperature requirement protein A [Culicoidibacterales bacterium]
MKFIELYQSCTTTWWAKPSLQPVFGHRQASWIELFFDLMFVAAISVLNHQAFAHNNVLSLMQLLSYLAGFLSVWLLWMSMTFFSNWFETNSVRHRFIVFANIVPLGLLSFGITTELQGTIDQQGIVYIASFMLSRISLLLTWRSANQPGLLKPVRQALQAIQWVYGFSIMCAIIVTLMLIVWQLPMYYGLIFWTVCVIGEFIALPIIFAHSQKDVTSLHRGHLTERFGLFTMLLLGEMIIMELTGFRQQPLSLLSIVEMVLGLSVIFGYWWVYYDQVLSTAFRETGRSRIIWTTFHFVFALTTVMISANFEFITEDLGLAFVTQQWLVIGLLIFFITITVLHYTLDHEHFYAQLSQTNNQEKLANIHHYLNLIVIVRVISIGFLVSLLFIPIRSSLLMLSLLALMLGMNAFAGLTVWLQATKHLSEPEE